MLNLIVNYSGVFYDTLTLSQDQLPYDYYGNQVTEMGDVIFVTTTDQGCDSLIYLHVDLKEGIEQPDNMLANVKVYPNPTRGMLTIGADEVTEVEVLDIVGRRVASFKDTNTIDISKLESGTYSLRITTPYGIVIRKVVKK